ncbi:MAG: serine--tRNA ligase [Oscillospiraceae bacterium]|nr:serine--tRNA ligase [Oscillospiraceae bacterium]
MLDIRLIRENPDAVKAELLRKGADAAAAIDGILELDGKLRQLIQSTEQNKAEQNKVSKQIPAMKKAGEDTTEIMAQMKALSEAIKEADSQRRTVEAERESLLLGLPNLPDADIPDGGKENNEEVRTFGAPKTFGFPPQNHVDLCTNLGLIDYERGAKIAGSGFWIYRGFGARLEWALLNYFVDTHLGDGYELVLVPHLLNESAGLTAGQFPKFADDVFWIHSDEGKRERFLLPTAETALVSLHQGEIIPEAELPKKYISYTPCYRREAGSYRADERGMVRGHQFNKVEMVQFTRPADSDAAFDELVGKAERLVRDLGFHFRTVKLAAGDCSASMARTYDIEIHIPSMEGYKEVSSVSNARDYQARRGMMRCRNAETGKPEYLHTLNGSGLATSRILPAIVEQNQLADGSVVVPEVLRKYLGGLEIITPCKN